MILCIADILTSDELADIRKTLGRESFSPGEKTAGWAAREVKHNLQLEAGKPVRDRLQTGIADALARSELFALAAAPKTISPILFSRYETGMGYGDHVDNAVMSGKPSIRSDLSFTIFLGDPEEYDGGELSIEDMQGTQSFKLSAGAMLLYPSTSLHRVETVTRGVRSVAVGWVQSLIRSAEHRQMLFDLETVRREMFLRDGKTASFDTLSKTVSNLWRLWVDL